MEAMINPFSLRPNTNTANDRNIPKKPMMPTAQNKLLTRGSGIWTSTGLTAGFMLAPQLLQYLLLFVDSTPQDGQNIFASVSFSESLNFTSIPDPARAMD